LGVTASAIGTSLPEFGSALVASLQGEPELGVGIVVGANIWNVLGILGLTSLIAGFIKSDEISVNRDGFMAFIAGSIFFVFIIYGYFFSDKTISFIASFVMILTYIYYLKILIKNEKNPNSNRTNNDLIKSENKTPIEYDEELKTNNLHINNENVSKKLNLRNLFFPIIYIIGLSIGCKALVWSVENFGEYFNIPEIIMGLFVLSLFTTIPELFVTLSSTIKGLHDFSLGTVFGSCVFNILVGIGIPALFVKVPIEFESIIFDLPVMIGIIAFVLLLIKSNGLKLTRSWGILFLLIYLIYAVVRITIIPTLGFHDTQFFS
jgi:cation:H+ antiporter